jgi:sigma-54 specific flagellar transcriptional regulator A
VSQRSNVVLADLRCHIIEREDDVRLRLEGALAYAGVGITADPSAATFVLVGAADGSLLAGNVPVVAVHGRASPALVPHAHVDFPLTESSLSLALDRVAATLSPACPARVFRELAGISTRIARVREMMSRVADRDVTVLITGESGTGKEIVARSLHQRSARRQQPFVPVNCGAIPGELLESELFGHVRGAFTGAIAERAGRFELAAGGTLFLDEIGDLPLHMQVKLLRVLQERRFERVGSAQSQKADVRIIAATHKNLEAMIERGEFREDLFYRLNVFDIEMPALRDRIEDLPVLIDGLRARMRREGRGDVQFADDALEALGRHRWPGNIRELGNLIERMAILHPGETVSARQLPPRVRGGAVRAAAPPVDAQGEVEMQPAPGRAAGDADGAPLPALPVNGIDLRDYVARLERNLIQQALDDTNAVVAHAAERLQIRRTTLVEKMRKYGLGRG